MGGKDIYVTEFKDGLWQMPENLGDVINTPFDDVAPFLAIDNHTLYFASNGHPGFGGYDIFVSRKNIDGGWSQPENLGHTVNTPYDEMSCVVHANGQKAYFASNRSGGHGGYDLYEVWLPEAVRPQPMSIVYGKVVDTFTNNKLPNAIIDFYNAETQTVLGKVFSNKGDGSYAIPLPINTKIVQKIFRFGYREYEDTFSLESQMVSSFELKYIPLVPTDYEYPVIEEPEIVLDLTTINFKRNQLNIQEDILHNISERLRDFLVDTFTIQIYSYTDDTGTPFINQDYSERRAQLVADYLITKGFEPGRLDIKGWGDANTLVPNDSDENRYINRRIEVKVVGTESQFKNMDFQIEQ